MEKPVESEVIYEQYSGNNDNQDTDAIAHTEVPGYQVE